MEVAIVIAGMDLVLGVVTQESFVVNFFMRDLNAWNAGVLAIFETDRLDQHLHVSWVSLVTDPVLGEADNAIEEAHLLVAVLSLTQMPFDSELENLFKTFAIDFEAISWPDCSKVVAVDDDGNLQCLIPETARGRQTSSETEIQEGL